MTGVARDQQIGGGIRLEREGEKESSDKHLEEREGKKGTARATRVYRKGDEVGTCEQILWDRCGIFGVACNHRELDG